MSAPPVTFSATGTIQSFVIPAAGTYVIEAAGGEGGAGATPGVKGAQVAGMFHLRRGEILKIVAGRQGAPATSPDQPGSRGGSSLVWSGPLDLPNPIKLLISARGGAGAEPVAAVPGASDPASPAVDPAELAAGVRDLDRLTADSLATVWTAGGASSSPRPAGAAKPADECGYNAGAFRRSALAAQSGHGCVSIKAVTLSAPTSAPAPATPPTEGSAAPLPAAPAPADVAPSPTVLPPVTPRPRSWSTFLRRRPGAD